MGYKIVKALSRMMLAITILLKANVSVAQEERYYNELKGPQLSSSSFFSVRDEKFGTPSWSLIDSTVTAKVDNIISLEFNFDTSLYFYNAPITCKVNFNVKCYGNPSDTSLVTAEYNNIDLQINYDTTSGKPYKGIAYYKFIEAYKYSVVINSVTSPQRDPVPAILKLRGSTVIKRKYVFNDNSSGISQFSQSAGQINIYWAASDYPGAEMFDLEYTVIDSASAAGEAIKNNFYIGGVHTVPSDTLDAWFTNNSTRITTYNTTYQINQLFNSGFIIFRIRGVQLRGNNESIRYEGNWNYQAKRNGTNTPGSAVIKTDWHESNLNWQYTASFAEEGKRKDVISYFDGSLRSRQSVTINSSDNTSVVQETMYDPLGRAAVSVLPVPTTDNTLHYFRDFNKNPAGSTYSYTDIASGVNCTMTVQPMDSSSGSSRYYSANNDFKDAYYYAKYIPHAERYPFAATEYMSDNTGRIRRQGGVGAAFQLGSGHETRYLYSKPTQTSLDRLFGNEAGNFNHYLKNAVIDANGQISVSYINASGKTVATALAGASPAALDSLPSNTGGASVRVVDDLIQSENFTRDYSDNSLSATSTFSALITGNYQFKYQVSPLTLQILHGSKYDNLICSHCYYDLVVTVKDDCGGIINQANKPAGYVFDTSSAPRLPIIDSFIADISKVGDFYVTYALKVSNEALGYYDSVNLVKNSNILKYNSFLLNELKQADFYGCYNDCQTCLEKLGTISDFTDRFKSLYLADSISFSSPDSLFVLNLYDSLLQNCIRIRIGCKKSTCDEKLDILKEDVKPGGQYALYDTAHYTLSDPLINILAKRSQIKFFTDENGKRDSVMVTDANGGAVLTDVKQLSDSLFISKFKDVWADSLVKLHPEYCYYLWCVKNSASSAFDRSLDDDFNDADTAMLIGYYHRNNDPSKDTDYDALLNKDPFFTLPGSEGVAYYQQMKDSLALFSRTLLRFTQSDKNILQYIDNVIYCGRQSDGWDNCHVDSACRAPNREWELYKSLYLNLKQQFYEMARRGSTDPVFANCVNCFIGKDIIQSAALSCTPLPASDFSLRKKESSGTSTPSQFQQYFIYYKDGNQPVKFSYLVDIATPSSTIPGTTDTFTMRFSPYVAIDTVNRLLDTTGANTILKVYCNAEASYQPFITSSCNYSCPAGVYADVKRPKYSYYIQYGTPASSATGVPAGYANPTFFTTFNVQYSTTNSCEFKNVWVAIYDSACNGTNPPSRCTSIAVTNPPSYCASNSNTALYENKTRRYPEYVNPDEYINGLLSKNPQQNSDENMQIMLAEGASNCEAAADLWITSVSNCTSDTIKLQQLKQALIEVCSKGVSIDRPFGASTVEPGIVTPYHSFEEAIVGILGPGAINNTCTAELIASPYPYNKQAKSDKRTIKESDADICSTLGRYKKQYQSSGFTGSFHAYLKQQFPGDYDLDSTALNDLQNSCTNCNGLLKDDIVLPLSFEKDATPCLSCDIARTVLNAFNAKFPGMNIADSNYEVLYSNYFNHYLGYSYPYSTYMKFLQDCDQTGFTGNLCNVSQSTEATISQNSCIAELFSTAQTNSYNRYVAYIDSVRRDFREAYLTKCMGVQPNLIMSADLYEYHYTLYYYDQSGNLVKTIPPKGVQLLTDTQIGEVRNYRLFNKENCYQYSDSVRLNNNGRIVFPYSAASTVDSLPFTVEYWLNLKSYSDQKLLARLANTDSNRVKGYALSIGSNKLKVSLLSVNTSLVVDTATLAIDTVSVQLESQAASNLDVNALIPLDKWTHVTIARTSSGTDPILIYIDGKPVGINYEVNTIGLGDLDRGVTPALYIGYDVQNLGSQQGHLNGTLKNVRTYNRLLNLKEIRQNAFNLCQNPTDVTGLTLWAPLNNAPDNIVKDLALNNNGTLAGFTWTPYNGVFPAHTLPTNYEYNSLNQVLTQSTPDAGTSKFWYDRLGRLNVSQNAEQLSPANGGDTNRYSYTLYDNLGRITEVGEKTGAAGIDFDTKDSALLSNWLATGNNKQVTKTLYDNVNTELVTASEITDEQTNVRKRVVATLYSENGANATYDRATHYTYDVSGNVKTLWQEIGELRALDGNGIKKMDYDYDLVSGKVNKVSYQYGKGDQFFYKYLYDAENRVTNALSSRDGLTWINDASYRYYLHGPLARTELGQYKIQGIDYAYTLQGWLKGVNSSILNPGKDIGNDGLQGTTFGKISRDVMGFTLGYYNNDYIPIDIANAPAFGLAYQPSANVTSGLSGKQLFNGNISNTTLALSMINNGLTTGYTYLYDQLNRLKATNQHTLAANPSVWDNTSITDAYKEQVTYDANGNILSYDRNGANTANMPKAMDNLTYHYLPNSNKLDHVDDLTANSSNYTTDIDDQDTLNYKYDNIGNLTSDAAEHISKIDWTVYGKIKSINKASQNTTINYYYDVAGNRVVKDVTGDSGLVRTFYIRDAQGNTMGVYRLQGNNYYWDEQHLYGSSRTGIWNWNKTLPARPPVADASNATIVDSLLLGSRNYELSNHLGNVLAVISDKKIGVSSPGDSSLTDYYKAEVLAQNDYYPFGMQMPGRKFAVGTGYSYGFNGKENDNEIKGEGNQQDYGMRIYDPRVGRFLSVDPITSKYPELTPYQFASNRPIDGIDMDGLEYVKFSDSPIEWIYQFGQGFFKGEGDVYKGVDAFNRGVNPIGFAAHGIYGTATGKDLITQNPVNRTTAFTDMVVNGVMLASGEKLLAGLTAESQLTKQAVFNRAAVGRSTGSAATRQATAESFYKSVNGNVRDVSGINLTREVSPVGLNSNTKLYQWTIDGKMGDYFSTSANAKNLGLPQMADGTPAYFDRTTNALKPRTLMEVTLPENVQLKGLKSTASDIKPWDGSPGLNKGGDIQVYAPGVKTSSPKLKKVN